MDIFLKVPEAKFFWHWRAPCEHQRCKLHRGVWGQAPQDIFEIAHSGTLFPAFLEPRNQFPRRGSSLLQFSLKRTIFNETGQLVEEWEGGMATTEFSVVYRGNFFFQKRWWGTITEVVIFVTSISFKWKGKTIKQQRNLGTCIFCYPLVSNFMSCFSKKMIIKKFKKPSNIGIKVTNIQWQTTRWNVQPLASKTLL